MNRPAKAATISAACLLLGFGLCGLDQALHPNNHDSFGGTLSFLGFVLLSLSALVLFASLIALLIDTLLNRRSK